MSPVYIIRYHIRGLTPVVWTTQWDVHPTLESAQNDAAWYAARYPDRVYQVLRCVEQSDT